MPILTPVPFPLFPILDGGKCGCGNEKCGRVGKHPAVKWADVQLGSPVPRPAPGAGYGLKTGAAPKGSGIVVVDCDSQEAADAFAQWLGFWPAETYTVETPRGWHLYFSHPGFPVKNSAGDLLPGVDIRGDGGFVVGPGSPHKSGTDYILFCGVDPAPCPPKLLEWLRSRPVAAEVQPHVDDVTDPTEREHRRKLFVEDCKTMPPSVQGKAGDAALFNVVQRGAYDYALPTEDVLEIVAEHFDPRCDPPWGDELDERVIHKANDAKTKSTRPRIEPPPAMLAHVFTLEAPPKPEIIPVPTRPKNGLIWGAWDEPVPPIDYLVEPLIPRASVGMFVAHGNSLKTWTMLSVASAITQGNAWLGRHVTKQGRALILDYESGMFELRRRIRLLEGSKPIDTLGAWSYPPPLDKPDMWQQLCKLEGVALLCVDSLAECAGGDENQKEGALPLQLAARYSEATGASVLFIHHAKKDDGGDARKKVRGSTAIFAACDWVYDFEPIEETPAYVRMRISPIKVSVGQKPQPFGIELTDRGLTLLESMPQPEKGLDEGVIASRIKLALANGPLATVEKIARAAGVTKGDVGEELKALVVQGDVVFIDGKGYSLDGPRERVARVLEQVYGLGGRCPHKTEEQIAKAATVDVLLVRQMLVSGAIVKEPSTGRFFIPPTT